MADDLDYFGSAGFGPGGLAGLGNESGAWDEGWGGTSSGGIFGGSDGSIFGGFGSAAKGIGGLIGGFQDSAAFQEQAQSYKEAAAFARENANLTDEATLVKQYQEQRKVTKALGGIRASQAANGFGQGGAGLSILRDSTMQGSLIEGQIGLQGTIEKNAYLAQAAKAEGEAKAAKAAASKAETGGIFSGISGIFGAVSSIVGLF